MKPLHMTYQSYIFILYISIKVYNIIIRRTTNPLALKHDHPIANRCCATAASRSSRVAVRSCSRGPHGRRGDTAAAVYATD